MAYFAKIENNIVTEIISVSNDICGEPTLTFPETDSVGRAFIANTLKLEGVWKQTSYSSSFRGTYAGLGYSWDGTNFVAPEPPIEE